MSTKAHCVLSPLIMLKIIHLCLIVVVVCVTPDRKEERLFDLTVKKDFHLLFWFAHALKVTQCPVCIYSLQGKQCVGVAFLTEAVSELYVFAMSFSFVSFVVWHCWKWVAVARSSDQKNEVADTSGRKETLERSRSRWFRHLIMMLSQRT